MSPFVISTIMLLAGTGYLTLRLLAHKAALRMMIKRFKVEQVENWAIRQAVAERLNETLEHLKRNEENHEICEYIADELSKVKPLHDLAQGFMHDKMKEAANEESS